MDVGALRLGRAFRVLRLAAGFSQEQLAERADVVPSYVCRFELGHYRSPGYWTLDALARALRLRNASDLMSRLERIATGSDSPPMQIAS